MLLRLLLPSSDRPGRTAHAFRWRGDGVSRIEGLSDAVFGFAITLVAVSLEVPRTASELLHNALGFIPFVASFLMLFFFWRSQFEFFRRYGLEDERTIWTTGLLLVSVLFLIYPLKFLFTVFSDAIMAGDVAKDRLRLEQFPAVLALYALGFLGVGAAFTLLYRHAHHERTRLELTEFEAFETMAKYRGWRGATLVIAAMLIWTCALAVTHGSLRSGNGPFPWIYYGGLVAVMLLSLSQRFGRKQINRERAALLARLSVDDGGGTPMTLE